MCRINLPSLIIKPHPPVNLPVEASTPLPIKYPRLSFKKSIIYVTDVDDFVITCTEILYIIDSNPKVDIVFIGFDVEWPFSRRKGPGKLALIQLCLDENICFLFHVYHFSGLPGEFIQILKHPKIRLVGLNIASDVRKIGRDFNLNLTRVLNRNCIDISYIARHVLHIKGIPSLKKLVRFLFQRDISKCDKVRRSNWDNVNLTATQKVYAATDAYVSYHRIDEHR